ncbi:hypothetical protein P3T73_07395 [Kiritimatiellota bacterium B12222]|nr:hypothetical protein P3T73_07395 [Kiritimatiellota bacterium B12222]
MTTIGWWERFTSHTLNVDWVEKKKEFVKLGIGIAIGIETEDMRSPFAQFFDTGPDCDPDFSPFE